MDRIYEHHVLLCRKVLFIEPYKFKSGSRERRSCYQKIAEALNQIDKPKFKVDLRSVRDKLQKLEKTHKSKTRSEENASGISPEQTELDMLLDDIIARSEAAKQELDRKSDEQLQKDKQDEETAQSIRQKAVEHLGETMKRQQLEGELPKAKRNRKSNAATMQYLKEGHAFEQELRSKELELKQREQKFREESVKEARDVQKQMWTAMQQQQQQLQEQNQVFLQILGKLADKL